MLVRLPRLRWAYYALMPVLAMASLITWQGLPSFLSAAATTLSTIGRMQSSETVLRVLLLASTPFWTAHDLVVGSLPGLVADLLSMTTGATMLLRRSPAIRIALMSAMRQLGRLVVKKDRILTEIDCDLALVGAALVGRPGSAHVEHRSLVKPVTGDAGDRSPRESLRSYKSVSPRTTLAASATSQRQG
jgi:Bacterial inner membrane protein